MHALLDTHVLIWHLEAASKLPQHLVQIVEDPDNTLFLSIASLWEIAIKLSLKKLHLPLALEALIQLLEESQITLLPVQTPALLYLQKLPWHHRDPFDRLLIAQSLSTQLDIISSDKIFDVYSVHRIWEAP